MLLTLLRLALLSLCASLKIKEFVPETINITVDSLPTEFTESYDARSIVLKPSEVDQTLNLPAGFQANIYSEDIKPTLNQPRWLVLTPDGDVLVTETPDNKIRLLRTCESLFILDETRFRDTDNDGVADESFTFADETNGLNQPLGMTFVQINDTEYWFLLGNTNAVMKYKYRTGSTNLGNQKGEKIADLPGLGYHQHWTRNVVNAGNGKVYVTVGSETNVEEETGLRATVSELKIDGSSPPSIIVSGIRNPVGLAVHPVTKEVYVAVNERDELGNDLVPDYMTRIQQDEFYGWPWAYLRKDRLDPRHLTPDNTSSTNPEMVARTKTPDVLFQAHSCSLGLTFYKSEKKTFPEKYHAGAFVAFRGSWNRWPGTGYKLVYVPFDSATNRPLGHYEDFLTGFYIGNSTELEEPEVWGRPVSVLSLHDGSLLFTEEVNNRIYRIQYAQKDTNAAVYIYSFSIYIYFLYIFLG